LFITPSSSLRVHVITILKYSQSKSAKPTRLWTAAGNAFGGILFRTQDVLLEYLLF
jgi:hypothetical protein